MKCYSVPVHRSPGHFPGLEILSSSWVMCAKLESQRPNSEPSGRVNHMGSMF